MSREEAMRRHPSYLAKVVRDAQDRQAMDVANRERADLEAWGMAPMYRVNEKHHEATTSGAWWVHIVGPAGLAAFIIVVITLFGLLGEAHGGWPA